MIRRKNTEAFSLIEVTLALGVAAISLIAIFGLLPIGLQTSHNAIEESASSDILSAVIADLRATALSATESAQFGISIPSNSGGAGSTLYLDAQGRIVPSQQEARYRLTVTFPPNQGAKSATLVSLRVTWPGVADPINATGSAETFTALDRN